MNKKNLKHCSKCNSHIVPKVIKAKGHVGYDGYACPVCNKVFHSYNLKGILLFVGLGIVIWAILFIHHHLTN